MMRIVLRTSVLLAAVFLAGRSNIKAQEADDDRSERLAEMRRRANALLVRYGEGEEARRLKPFREPRLRFGDPTRAFHDGTLWIWTEQSRLVLMVGIEHYGDFWSYELISLARQPLEAQDETGWLWRPRDEPAIDRPIPKSPPPAESAALRRLQRRDLVRRFSAVEYLGPDRERIQLRLQPRPIVEYAGEGSGALFVFSNGTNPELLLMLETARRDGAETWRYGVARISTAELALLLDGAQVWSVPHLETPKTQTSYTYFSLPITAGDAD